MMKATIEALGPRAHQASERELCYRKFM
jgi:hypothetical protein